MNKKHVIVLILILAILITILMIAKSCSSNNSSINRLSLTPQETTSIIPDKLVILEKVQQLSKLETAVFSFQQVIKGTKDNGALWGSFKDEITFVAFGQVIAGIDLSKIATDDIILSENNLTIKLPPAEIFNVVLDNQRSYIASRTTGFLTYPDSNLETQVRQEAVRQFEADAINFRVLDIAVTNAQADIKNFLQNFGFDSIKFEDQSPSILKLYPE